MWLCAEWSAGVCAILIFCFLFLLREETEVEGSKKLGHCLHKCCFFPSADNS